MQLSEPLTPKGQKGQSICIDALTPSSTPLISVVGTCEADQRCVWIHNFTENYGTSFFCSITFNVEATVRVVEVVLVQSARLHKEMMCPSDFHIVLFSKLRMLSQTCATGQFVHFLALFVLLSKMKVCRLEEAQTLHKSSGYLVVVRLIRDILRSCHDCCLWLLCSLDHMVTVSSSIELRFACSFAVDV